MKGTRTINATGLFMALMAMAMPREGAATEIPDSVCVEIIELEEVVEAETDSVPVDSLLPPAPEVYNSRWDNIYAHPYSLNRDSRRKWGRLWANTGVLAGAYVGTLLVLECLPEDATSWNRAEIQDVPLFTRWKNHVIKEGPEWDHDKFVFNYVLHPYAGAAYFMAARSCGFNFWRSFLYSAIISTVGWEFGIEAFMERPSYQDIFITPIVGSCIGELFYKVKRRIVSHDYTLGGSKFLGNVVVFLVDPVNEVVNLFRGSDTRNMHLHQEPVERGLESHLVPVGPGGSPGFSLSITF